MSFDPTFQYRFTQYFVDWGFWPAWDELTYYVGRPIDSTLLGPFMIYITAILFWLLKPFGFGLFTTCSYAAAIYGAAIVFPAFLLGRELSNKYGGIFAAALMGTAPQILIRTFGSSYDTDQMALFFLVFTLYLGVYMLRKKDIKSFTLAFIGFISFMLAWGLFIYSYMILAAFVVLNLIVATFLVKKEKIKESIEIKLRAKERFANAFRVFKTDFILMVALLGTTFMAGWWLKARPWLSIPSIIGFALKPEAWIVNISIAELQPFNIFDINGWMLATGRFMMGVKTIDTTVFLIFVAFMAFGLYSTYKKDLRKTSFLLTLLIMAVYTTVRGIRFTEFSSALFIILIGVGFGYFTEYCKKDNFLKAFSLGLAVCIVFIGAGIGMQLGQQLGPDVSANWDSTWQWLREETPELSIVGTWWDPGHMISALAERRNFADGAHCPDPCMYNINDRITDLGAIMATTDENHSLELIKKYQGTSPKVYWIASDDLVSKFQWLQYFGTGCDARVDPTCPLYGQIPRSDVKYTEDGQANMVYFQNIVVILGEVPVPLIIQGKSAAVAQEVVFYDLNGNLKFYDLSDPSTITSLKIFESELEVNIVDQIIPYTVYVPQHYGSIVLIPPHLRNAVFTKMYFYDGIGLDHFKLVFKNDQVKIYEVV